MMPNPWRMVTALLPFEATTLHDIGFNGEPLHTEVDGGATLLTWSDVPECEPIPSEYTAELMRSGHERALLRAKLKREAEIARFERAIVSGGSLEEQSKLASGVISQEQARRRQERATES